MGDRLAAALSACPVLLADGAIGTGLFAMGLAAGEAPEQWNESAPDRVRSLHDSFLNAGSDLILTNSFGANRHRLAMHGRADDAFPLARSAAEIARAAADAAGRGALVAGSMGPTGSVLEPAGDLSVADAADAFEEQARGLVEGGVDLLWGETISSKEEALALSLAADRVGAPYALTMSFDTAGRTMMGLTPRAFVEFASNLARPPSAVGANCGTGASDLLATVLALRAAGPNLPLIAKANAGIPKFVDGQVVYDGTPAAMARYAVLARDSGARIVGGCCGTAAAHVVAMRKAMDAAPVAGAVPSLATIARATGPFLQSSSTDGPRRRSGRRKRTK